MSSHNKVWIVVFSMALISFVGIVAQRLGWLSSKSGEPNTRFYNEIAQQYHGKAFPNFTVLTTTGDTFDVFDLIKSTQNRSLIVMLGSGCVPCDDRTIQTLSNFQRKRQGTNDFETIVLVSVGIHEFVHLRKLTTYKYNGKIAKFSTETFGKVFDRAVYPALYLVENSSQKILDCHFPTAFDNSQLEGFLEKISDNSLVTWLGRFLDNSTEKSTSKAKEPSKKSDGLESLKPPQGKLIPFRRISLQNEPEDALISEITGLSVAENGQLFISHERGQKITIFSPDGKYLRTFSMEDILGPGQKQFRCVRMHMTEDAKACFLLKGAQNHVVIYDFRTEKFIDKTPLSLTNKIEFRAESQKKNFPRNNAILDFAFIDETYLLYLIHPHRALGQKGLAQVFKVVGDTISESFLAFSDLEFPNMAEHIATSRDQLHFRDGVIYISSPLDNRIYRFDSSGKRLKDLIYPKGHLEQLNRDVPEKYSEWFKYFDQLGEIDLISSIFPFKGKRKTYVVVARQKKQSIYFDLFDSEGNLEYLGDYTDMIAIFPIAYSKNYIYGYNWPAVELQQFQAIGNPEIIVYRIDPEAIFKEN